MDHMLPVAVTLGRFLEEQRIEPLREDALFQEEMLALPIQTISFGRTTRSFGIYRFRDRS
ncbi:MAG: hypothetical protein AB7E31_14240 [Desulfitobacterium sp.]